MFLLVDFAPLDQLLPSQLLLVDGLGGRSVLVTVLSSFRHRFVMNDLFAGLIVVIT